MLANYKQNFYFVLLAMVLVYGDYFEIYYQKITVILTID